MLVQPSVTQRKITILDTLRRFDKPLGICFHLPLLFLKKKKKAWLLRYRSFKPVVNTSTNWFRVFGQKFFLTKNFLVLVKKKMVARKKGLDSHTVINSLPALRSNAICVTHT